MNIKERISRDEHAYEQAIRKAADSICADRAISFVLITGGSCAGKTTTTKKLAALISSLGRKTHTVSLDDFYKNPEDAVYLPDGTRDIESPASLETGMIREAMRKIAAHEITPLPRYDFTAKHRIDGYSTISPEEGDVVLIEGLHAFNPLLHDSSIPANAFYRIYLYADAQDGSDCRLVRRLVRDSRHRAADAQRTYSLWRNVIAGEKKYIEPFRKYADIAVNTFFGYERAVLDNDAAALLSHLPEDSEYLDEARALMSLLCDDEIIEDGYVPENSLLREFM